MNTLVPDAGIGKVVARERLLAVLVIDRVDDAVPVAEALLAGGVRAMELTLRTPAALDAARSIATALPEMTVGIGTILNEVQVDQAIDGGAAFGVSPGTNPSLLRYAAEKGLPFGPGVMTPSDVDSAIREGARLLKFFPATSSGGLPHLGNIAAPFAHLGIGFIPLGGVGPGNLAEWLSSPLVAAVGGSWLAPRKTIADGDWKTIETNAREARRIVEEAS